MDDIIIYYFGLGVNILSKKIHKMKDKFMADMLVRLWNIPEKGLIISKLNEKNIVIRKPIGAEKIAVMRWIRERFSEDWLSESECAFFNDPRSIYIAVRETPGGAVGELNKGEMLGFACYDAGKRGYFGPTGVDEKERGRGIGVALLLSCLHDMREAGYGYAIIGWVGPVDFYKKTVGATIIEDSFPGIYQGMLR